MRSANPRGFCCARSTIATLSILPCLIGTIQTAQVETPLRYVHRTRTHNTRAMTIDGDIPKQAVECDRSEGGIAISPPLGSRGQRPVVCPCRDKGLPEAVLSIVFVYCIWLPCAQLLSKRQECEQANEENMLTSRGLKQVPVQVMLAGIAWLTY